jgi:hypothetical protein
MLVRHPVTRGRHVDLSSPRGYYLDYSAWADAGDPWHGSALRADTAAGSRSAPSPSHVAPWALGNLELYLGNGNAGRRGRFEAGARWLVDNIEVIPGGFGGWAMGDPPEAFAEHLRPGWFSGAVHAECIATLARAASLIRADEALDVARTALGGFGTPVEDGGFLREVGGAGHEGGLDSPVFFEQYPMVARRSMVLAGHARAILTLFDYQLITGDLAARTLFDRSVRGLEFVLDGYDTGSWARRDLDDCWLGNHLADGRCFREQILLLDLLHEITGSEAFRKRACLWRGYAADWKARLKALFDRSAFRFTNVHQLPR